MNTDIYQFTIKGKPRRIDPLAAYRDIYLERPDFDDLWGKLKSAAEFERMSAVDRATIGAESLDAEKALVAVSRSVFGLCGDIDSEEYVSETQCLSVLFGLFFWFDEKKSNRDFTPTSDTTTATASSTDPTPNKSGTGFTSPGCETTEL